MKKQKISVAIGLTAAMTAGLISGCATKATPENLLRDMQKNAEKTGIDFSVETETYSVQEDDEYVTYTLIEDQWTKEVTDDGEITGEVESIADNMEEYADQFTLAEDLVTVNDKECFELTGELDGDLFSEMMQTDMTDSLAGYGIDEETLSDMVFPCTIDIYKDSILPARLYFDMKDTMAPAMEDSGVTISECYVDMTFMEYDTVEEITVPEEAVSSATDSGAAGGLDLPQDD